MKFDRKFYIHSSYSLLAADEVLGIEVWGDVHAAVAFHGKAQKPDWHYTFRSVERRDAKIAEHLACWRDNAERKAKNRAEKAAWEHGIKVGDIFQCTWGYEQTNQEYWEIVRVAGAAVWALEICQQIEETGWLRGDCAPAPGSFRAFPDYKSPESIAHHDRTGGYLSKVPEPRKFIPQKCGSSAYLRIHSFASAHKIEPVAVVAGVKVFGASSWTAYA